MTALFWILGILAAGIGGWFLGRRGGADGGGRPGARTEPVLRDLASTLSEGRRPDPGPDAPPGMGDVASALERYWAPRDEERERALRQALERVIAFLRHDVRDPLAAAADGGPDELRDGVAAALGAVEDLEFFLREPGRADAVHDLGPLLQQVTREFTQDWEVAVRLRRSDAPVRARVDRGSFMDALYLLLHNAGQFGGGGTVDVTVLEEGGRARIDIRDRGPGFTPEALERAPDLFYTTSEAGLGLGIPFARRIIRSFGGEVELANAEERGAEVRVSLPTP